VYRSLDYDLRRGGSPLCRGRDYQGKAFVSVVFVSLVFFVVLFTRVSSVLQTLNLHAHCADFDTRIFPSPGIHAWEIIRK